MGVRKRLSEDSLKTSYRLNGVQTGSAVARTRDRFGRWEHGYYLGIIVRRTASVVQIKWWGDPDNIHTYKQGDARYEVERGRWKILGILRGNPLEPDNPLADALTGMLGDYKMLASASADDPTPPTEENEDMADQSHAAAEREAAKRALANGDLKERETYTAKQVASRCGTDSKTMRKFFRSSHSTVEPVGQGGRYEFDAKDFPKIKKEFDSWRKRSQSRSTQPKLEPQQIRKAAEDSAAEDGDFTADQVADAIQDQIDQEEAADSWGNSMDREPSPEELEEGAEDLDLDDLDAEDD